MKQKRFTLFFLFLILCAFFLIFYLNIQYPSESEVQGIVQKVQIGGTEFWGIYEDNFLFDKRFRFDSLPEESQREGLNLRIKDGIADVIGTNDWETVIKITEVLPN